MKLIFMGSDAFAVPTLEALAKTQEHQLLAVVTQPDRPAGRARKPVPTPVKEAATRLGLKLLQPEKCRDEGFLRELRALAPGAIVVVAYGQILPKEILTLPSHGCINVHASLLPQYRGASPVAHAILNGDSFTGVTIMLMGEGLDTGPILFQAREPILSHDTTGRLEAQLAKLGAKMLLKTWDKDYTMRPQDDAMASYACKLRKEDGRIDWTLPAVQIERRIRAFNPWPSAFTFLEGKRLQIWRANISDKSSSPGNICHADENGIAVGTGQGTLIITELQREGGKRMSAAEFLRGFRLEVGQWLG